MMIQRYEKYLLYDRLRLFCFWLCNEDYVFLPVRLKKLSIPLKFTLLAI